METQLRLPRLYRWLETMRTPPREHLAQIKADRLDAKAQIRVVLDRLAAKHGIAVKDVDYGMGYVDDMLDDVVYHVETGLEREIEDQDPA